MILVTGATGRLGGHVVRALRKMGQPVRALVRKGSEYYWLNDSGCEYFFGDLRDPLSLRRACHDVRFVVVCSGVDLETRDNNHTTVTLEGHANLWNACRERGVERVVYVSAMGVERDYPVPWFQSKRLVEEQLQESGLNWTVLRPAPMTRIFAEYARAAARGKPAFLPGPATNMVAPIAGRDLALYAIAGLDLAELSGRAIEISGTEVMTARQVMDLALEKGGEGHKVSSAPGLAVKALASMVKPVGRRFTHRLLHRQRWFTDAFSTDMSEIIRLTGIEPMSVGEALDLDFSELIPLEDPAARDERVVHRKFDAIVYQPGEVDWHTLPAGPLRYDD